MTKTHDGALAKGPINLLMAASGLFVSSILGSIGLSFMGGLLQQVHLPLLLIVCPLCHLPKPALAVGQPARFMIS